MKPAHHRTDNNKFNGPLVLTSSCEKVLWGALALYGMDQLELARSELTLLKSIDGFKNALVKTVRQHFGVETWTAPF